MANDNQIKEMISAFAAGCMDQENFIQFKEYLLKGGDLPRRELGELQNTIALIPTILQTEKPPAEIKRKVAKRLIDLQDEIKEKIKAQKIKATLAREEAVETKEEEIHFDQVTPVLTTREVTIAKKEATLAAQKRGVFKKESKAFSDVNVGQNVGGGKKKKAKFTSLNSLLLITTIVFLFTTVGVYLFLGHKINSLNKEFDAFKKESNKIKKELIANKKEVSDYKQLLKFLTNRRMAVVELTGGKKYPQAKGMLYFSYETGDGALILENPPAIKEDEAYQLWLVTQGKSISLDVLPPNNIRKYYFIFNIPRLPQSKIQLFRITNEPKAGSVIPLGNTLLFGSFTKTE